MSFFSQLFRERTLSHPTPLTHTAHICQQVLWAQLSKYIPYQATLHTSTQITLDKGVICQMSSCLDYVSSLKLIYLLLYPSIVYDLQNCKNYSLLPESKHVIPFPKSSTGSYLTRRKINIFISVCKTSLIFFPPNLYHLLPYYSLCSRLRGFGFFLQIQQTYF